MHVHEAARGVALERFLDLMVHVRVLFVALGVQLLLDAREAVEEPLQVLLVRFTIELGFGDAVDD